MRGENTEKVYRLGGRVRVQVLRVDLEQRRVELGIVEILAEVRADERRRGPRRSKAQPGGSPRGTIGRRVPAQRGRRRGRR
jgi:ribonuclease R